MSISGSINLTATAADIITEALEQLGELGENQSPNDGQFIASLRTLNYLCKWLQTKDLNLYAINRLFVFLQKNQREYSLGASSSDHFTTSYVATNLSADASSGATTLTVDSITGIADEDNIGIQLDDGTMQWTTVNGTPSGSSVVIDTALTDDAADNNVVFAYTTLGSRPMKVIYNQASTRKYDSAGSFTDITVDVIAREEYNYLSNKESSGQVNQIYYDPQITTGKLYVWPQTNRVSDLVKLWVVRTLSDLDEVTDDIEFPQEWYLPLSFLLAKWSLTKYGVRGDRANRIERLADEALEEVLGWDSEDYFQIQPETRYNR